MAGNKHNTPSNAHIDPASGTFGRRNAARYVGGTVAGESHASVKSYMVGFILSIILTAIPFGIVMKTDIGFSRDTILAIILVLAVVQVLVHVVYFLHMDRSAEQRWNLVAFVFTVVMLAIVVAGSIWIMANATGNMERHMDSEAVVPQR